MHSLQDSLGYHEGKSTDHKWIYEYQDLRRDRDVNHAWVMAAAHNGRPTCCGVTELQLQNHFPPC